MALERHLPRGGWKTLAEAAVWANLFFCALAWGGAVAWSLVPMVLLAFAGFGAVVAELFARGKRLWVPWLAVTLGLAIAVCCAQLIPLPTALLGLLSRPAAELRAFALVPLGFTRLRPVTLDAPATWRELAKHLAYAAVLLTAAHVSESRRVERRLLAVVAALGAFLGVVGLGHLLLDVHVLWGVFPYTHAIPPLVTPLGNPNHLAELLTVSSTLALGLALTANGRHRAGGWVLLYLLSGAGVLLSLSRGGIVFFGLAQVAEVGAAVWFRKAGPQDAAGRLRAFRRPLFALAILGVMAVVGAFVAYEEVAAEMETANSLEKIQHSKVELWPVMAEAAVHYWPLGMGRGAFEQGFSRFQTSWTDQSFTHAENIFLQLLNEFGFPVTLLLAALTAAVVSARARRVESLLEATALLAVGAGLLHELFDFSWELPAPALAVAVVLGALWRRQKDEGEGGRKVSRRWALGLASGGLALAVVASLFARNRAELAEKKVFAAAAAGSLPELRKEALAQVDLHPSDYLLYAAVGSAEGSARNGDPRRALAFLTRALFLKPMDAPSHRAAAWALRRLGKKGQALTEYRLAAAAVPYQASSVYEEALAIAQGEEELERLLGDRPLNAALLADELIQRHRAPEAEDVLVWAEAQVAPGVGGELWLRSARLHLLRKDPAPVPALLDEAASRGASASEVVMLRSEALQQLNRPEEAFQALESAFTKDPENAGLGFALAQSYLSAGRPARAREVLKRMTAFVRDRAAYFSLEGETFFVEGKLNRALDSYQSAERVAPERAGLHYRVAQIQEALNHHADAIAEVRAGLTAEGPAGAERAQAWISKLEAAEQKLRDERKE